MTASLAFLAPRPRPVRLGGRDYLVGELTLGDIAELAALRESRRADPLAAVADLIDAPDVAAADRPRIAEAFERADGGGGEDAGDWGAELFDFARVALRRHHPDLTAGDVLAILEAITRDELAALRRAAYRPDPAAEIRSALGRWTGTGGDDGGGTGPDWPVLVDRVARSHGRTEAQIREMTLTQFRVALSEGKAPEGGSCDSAREAWDTSRRWDRWLSGKDD